MTDAKKATQVPDYSGLKAVFINCTLTPSPSFSHTECLMDVVRTIMEDAGVATESIRSVDHDIAPGVYPDMTDHGFDKDAWPDISGAVVASDILQSGSGTYHPNAARSSRGSTPIPEKPTKRASISSTARSAVSSSPAMKTA